MDDNWNHEQRYEGWDELPSEGVVRRFDKQSYTWVFLDIDDVPEDVKKSRREH